MKIVEEEKLGIGEDDKKSPKKQELVNVIDLPVDEANQKKADEQIVSSSLYSISLHKLLKCNCLSSACPLRVNCPYGSSTS